MTALLVTLTLVEIAAVVIVLVVYIVSVARSLRRTSQTLAKVAFGVRAIETQCEVIGPAVVGVNERLPVVRDAFVQLAALAQQAGGAGRGRPRRR